MEAVAEARAQKLIMTAFQKCRLWEGGDQCHFCAFFSGGNSLGAVDCGDVYETVREALKEPGRFQEIYVSGGTDFSGQPPFSEEVERYIRVLQAAGRNFEGRFPSQLMAPAYPKKVLRRIHDETGLTSYCPNIEVWDRRLFGILCPGKEKWIGREAWIRRTIDAVEIFGKGNVCTQVVAGAELARPHGFETVDQALKSNLEACEFFAREGVICLSTIWRPHRASRLGFQPMPPLEYYIRLAKGFHEIRRSYGLRTIDDDYRHCGNHPDSDLERLDVPEAGEDVAGPPVIRVSRRIMETLSFASPNGKPLILSLEEREEHSSLGRALVRAVWFGGSVILRVDTGRESLELEASVHRCHLAGPLFKEKYLELQERNPEAVLASVWELQIAG